MADEDPQASRRIYYFSLANDRVAGEHMQLIVFLRSTLSGHPRWAEVEPLLRDWESEVRRMPAELAMKATNAAKQQAKVALEQARAAVERVVGTEVMKSHPWFRRPSPTYKGIQLVLIEGLYISPSLPAKNLDLLRQHGITHVVQVMPKPPPFPDDLTYHVIPIDDSICEKIDFDAAVAFIDNALKSPGGNQAVLVHCQAGISRSASVVLAYLMKSKRIPLDFAYSMLVRCRPYVYPNSGFQAQLRIYERRLALE